LTGFPTVVVEKPNNYESTVFLVFFFGFTLLKI